MTKKAGSEATPVTSSEASRIAQAETEAVNDNEGRYVYCVGDGGVETDFGEIGVDGNEVYTIPFKDVSAVVHKCPSQPYVSVDNEIVKGWVIVHQGVVDAAWERLGTVLPLTFDTIIKGDDEKVKNWLAEEYEKLREKLNKVEGKAEFAVQIFWDQKIIGHKIAQESGEIRKLSGEMKGKPRGMAYFYKQKIERELKREMEAKADEYFKDFYGRVKKYADEILVEKAKRERDRQMLMNLSVLMTRDKVKPLGEDLAKIKEKEGLDVRFTGPWPPYSFV